MISTGIAIVAAFVIGGIFFALGAYVAARAITDADADLAKERDEYKRRLNRIAEQRTPTSNATVRRMAEIATGARV